MLHKACLGERDAAQLLIDVPSRVHHVRFTLKRGFCKLSKLVNKTSFHKTYRYMISLRTVGRCKTLFPLTSSSVIHKAL